MSRGKSLVEKAIKEQVSQVINEFILEKLWCGSSRKQAVVRVFLAV